MAGKKLAVIGAGEFQEPLIRRARELGLETHAFAWACGDLGEKAADFFHPVSTADREAVLETCRSVGVDGVCTIGSDFNNITASYVAGELGLTANPMDVVERSTNKHLMRERFAACGDPSPRSVLVTRRELDVLPGGVPDTSGMRWPLIVKPTDRSGSRGVARVDAPEGLRPALEAAFEASFEKAAVVEEFVTGEEFSVEYVSWQGRHTFLQMTKKFTTGAPHFIETGHFEPALVSPALLERVKAVVEHALDSLGVRFGASHSEVLVDAQGRPWIVEIGSRMGGDCIGSDLVELSSGVDFLKAVIDIALGREPDLAPRHPAAFSAVRFIFGQDDLDALRLAEAQDPPVVVRRSEARPFDHEVTDSSNRCGFFIMRADSLGRLWRFLP